MSSRMLHVGCGAIGSYTTLNLPESVDVLVLCDLDRVGPENIGIASFSPDEVGRRKVSALADRIRHARPAMVVEEIDGDVTRLSPAMIDSFELISAALDNDRAVFSLCRLVAQSVTKPCVVFANCDPHTGSAQVRILNFARNMACPGCARSRDRWTSPAATSHRCARGGARASGVAARFASALQVCVVSDLLRNRARRDERAGENLIINPSGAVSKSSMTFSEDCPAFYHVYARREDTTTFLGHGVQDMSVRTLLSLAADLLGDEAFLELGERRYAERFACTGCGAELAMLRLTDAIPPCHCGSIPVPVAESRRMKVSLRDSGITEVSLARCGFPEGDVLLAVGGGRYRYLATTPNPGWHNALANGREYEKS